MGGAWMLWPDLARTLGIFCVYNLYIPSTIGAWLPSVIKITIFSHHKYVLKLKSYFRKRKQTSLKKLHRELGKVAGVLLRSLQQKNTTLQPPPLLFFFSPLPWTATSWHFSRPFYPQEVVEFIHTAWYFLLQILSMISAWCYSSPCIPSCFHIEGALFERHFGLLSTLLLIPTPEKEDTSDWWVCKKELGVLRAVPSFLLTFESTCLWKVHVLSTLCHIVSIPGSWRPIIKLYLWTGVQVCFRLFL